MKQLPAFAALALTLLLAACALPTQDVGATQANAASPLPSPPTLYRFRCDSGQAIAATYPSTDSATVEYKGKTYLMQIAVSGSGARYVGGGLEWWTKGAGPEAQGTVLRHNADGTSGDVVESCTGL